MISVFVGDDKVKEKKVATYFKGKTPEKIVKEFVMSAYYKKIEIKDLLRVDYKNATYRKEAEECTPNDTVSRQEIWKENPQLVLEGGIINPQYDLASQFYDDGYAIIARNKKYGVINKKGKYRYHYNS